MIDDIDDLVMRGEFGAQFPDFAESEGKATLGRWESRRAATPGSAENAILGEWKREQSTLERGVAPRRVMSTLAQRVPFDAYVWGCGSRRKDGSVEIDRQGTFLEGLPDGFLRQYESIAQDDIVGRLFAHFPHKIQAISTDDYKTAGGRTVAEYLRSYRIAHLMVAGLESSYGLAWVTLYRFEGSDARAFTAEESELVARAVRYHLYTWQENSGRTRTEVPPAIAPMTVTEMRIADAVTDVADTDEIGRQLTAITGEKHSQAAVIDYAAALKQKLGLAGRAPPKRFADRAAQAD
jgi:hypothetical protein